MHSGNAPKRQSMNRSDAPPDQSDERAVDWWRQHPHGNGGVMSKSELDRMLMDNSGQTAPTSNAQQQQGQRDRQWEGSVPSNSAAMDAEQRSQGRLESRDPLQKPYDINRELPIRPKNGNILHPQLNQSNNRSSNRSLDPSDTSRQATDGSAMERFEAKLDTNIESLQPQLTVRREPSLQEEQMAVIGRVDSRDTTGSSNRQPVDPPGTPTHRPSLRYSVIKSRSNNSTSRKAPETAEKKPK